MTGNRDTGLYSQFPGPGPIYMFQYRIFKPLPPLPMGPMTQSVLSGSPVQLKPKPNFLRCRTVGHCRPIRNPKPLSFGL